MKNIINPLRSCALIVFTTFMSSCDAVTNSRPYKLYESEKELFQDGQESGDYTWFIISIIAIVILGIIYFKNKSDKNK